MEADRYMKTVELDATGLKCPLPVLKARKALKGLAPGDRLDIRATDPGSPADIRAFCETFGHSLEASEPESGVFLFQILKG
jgi:tRNA 2-thiouridine synthesizing protein A|tara:strand:- start:1367 stop:1609 length:243 start_codon:yes stop_codon:yes gene_type:complete